MNAETGTLTGTEAQSAPATPDLNLAIEVANSAPEGSEQNQTVNIDLSAIPQDARLELLRGAVRTTVNNRVNVAMVRNRAARAPFVAWAAYEAAIAADPLQTTVAKPEGEKPTGEAPAALDPVAKAQEAIADLLKGELRSQAKKGEGRSRKTADPLTNAVTNVVVRAVFEANKAAGRTVDNGKGGTRAYTFPDATKEVGGDGIKYLNAQIDAKVAAAPEAEQAELRKQLEKQRDTRYIEPAQVMLGLKTSKASAALPSIL
jgi:hypothetical protein